ncbi:MAG: hypothetical protein QG589_34 [Patescibacteria group bacterium]|nr:hypothetical protein [Patescibacteria group bacterium]
MAILFTIPFFILLNIPALIFIITGIIFLKDNTGIKSVPQKKDKIIGTILIIVGVIFMTYGLLTGYGLQ